MIKKKNGTSLLTNQELVEVRKMVVQLHLKGKKVMEIVRLTDLTYPAVRKAIDLYEEGGWEALNPKQMGRRFGQCRVLTEKQEEEIQKLICEKRPEQLKMKFALWTRSAVVNLIESKYEIRMKIRTIGHYLKRWGFTPQKPIKKAYEQRPEAVKKWLNEEYPEIARRARTEGAEIHWGDETALMNTDVRGRGYAPKGKTPVTYAPGGARQKLSMIATVTNRGEARWMIIEEAFNADKLIEFMGYLIKSSTKKVFLILDNLRVHHCKPVKEWASKHKKKIELFYLPSYSPELNPEERLNANLKQTIETQVPARTKEQLKEATSRYMSMLERSSEMVKAFFQDRHVKYAA